MAEFEGLTVVVTSWCEHIAHADDHLFIPCMLVVFILSSSGFFYLKVNLILGELGLG
jgi:Cu2+-containing amine oxidase